VRSQVVTLLSGGPFERIARSAYSSVYDRIPAPLMSPAALKERAYNRLTIEIAKQALSHGGNSVDVGAHHGGILSVLLKASPNGRHWAFEPIPNLARQLRKRFPTATVEEVALSDYTGHADFHFLPGAAAYSSLMTRPEIETGQEVRPLRVDVRRLDDCVPENVSIAFLKIDVEGAEAAVLRGATRLLGRDKPVVVFECASAKLPDSLPVLEEAGLRVSFLSDYVAGRRMPPEDVARLGRERGEYYYVASPG